MKIFTPKNSVLAGLCLASFAAGAFLNQTAALDKITAPMVKGAQVLIGLNFTADQVDSTVSRLTDFRKNYEAIRQVNLPNNIPPALLFNPIPVGFTWPKEQRAIRVAKIEKVRLPANQDTLAFYNVRQLADLIKTKQITSEELTRFFIARLKKYNPKLLCVTTLTEELALAQARRADAEIKKGKYRGWLHGIPYGAKDLLSTRTYKTTWGSVPYQNQVIDEDATVIKKLEEAGAVLVAKTTLGELAMGDVWYGGKTKSPWNLQQGSSGSSAGSAAAVAAGLLPFAIGTETLGSIVSPSTACGTTGLRPTFGRVSRTGAMALSWSMDKIGPIARTTEDCALIFNAIYGPDGVDQSVYDAPFNYHANLDIKKLRVGYVKAGFDRDYATKANDLATLEILRKLGVNLIPIELPNLPASDLTLTITVEGAAAFDELTRSGRDKLMVNQGRYAWPNTFRAGRFVPAVEYLQAQRVRYLLVQEMAKIMQGVDAYVAPSFGNNLYITNLTGHPCVVVPNGFNQGGMPTTISFTGTLFGEANLLALAKYYQDATTFHLQHPNMVWE